MGKTKFLRNVSQISAGVVGLHVAMFAIYYSVGQIFFIAASDAYNTTGRFLVVTGVIALAIFCLSTQFSMQRNADR